MLRLMLRLKIELIQSCPPHWRVHGGRLRQHRGAPHQAVGHREGAGPGRRSAQGPGVRVQAAPRIRKLAERAAGKVRRGPCARAASAGSRPRRAPGVASLPVPHMPSSGEGGDVCSSREVPGSSPSCNTPAFQLQKARLPTYAGRSQGLCCTCSKAWRSCNMIALYSLSPLY